jgi:hypothetical protein
MAKTSVRDIPENFLHCRVRGHKFEQLPDDGGRRRNWKESRSVRRIADRCERCMSYKLSAWNGYTNQILFNDYRYSAGYLLTEGHFTRAELRAEFMRRKMDNRRFE